MVVTSFCVKPDNLIHVAAVVDFYVGEQVLGAGFCSGFVVTGSESEGNCCFV